MNVQMVFQRFFVPQLITNIYYLFRYRCLISGKAEVELSGNIRFGKWVTISSFTKLKATEGPLVIGTASGFATSCFVAASSGGIHIGNDCLFGPNVNIVASNYRTDRLDIPFKDQGSSSKGITIGNNVWVGAGTTILDGTIIGDNTIVVANSLLNRHYRPNVVLQGNPAKVILRRNLEETEKEKE